jgi:hypothetical protein
MKPSASLTRDERDRRWIHFYLGVAALVVVAFYPGRMVPDTIDMCSQALTGQYTDWHSPTMAGIWGFLGLEVDMIFLFQTFAIVFAMRSLLRPHLRPAAVAVVTLVVTFNPATLSWLAHVGKDQWFCAFILWCIAALSAAARTDDAKKRRRLTTLALVLAWFSIAARGNAAAAVLGAFLPFASILTPRRFTALEGRARRAVMFGWLVGVVASLAFSVAIYERIVVDPQPRYVEQATMSFDLAGMSKRTGELLLPPDVLYPGSTLEDVSARFDERKGESWFFESGSPLRYPLDTASEVAKLKSAWLRSIFEHPVAYLQVRVSYTLAQLGISQPHPGGSMSDVGSRPEAFGLSCELPKVAAPRVNRWLNQIFISVDSSHLIRGWFFLVLLIGAVVLTWRPPNNEARALLGAALLNELSVALLGVSATYRYCWFLALTSQLATALTLRRLPHFRSPRFRLPHEDDTPTEMIRPDNEPTAEHLSLFQRGHDPGS